MLFKNQKSHEEGEKMKFCEKCGKELFDEAVICPGCGCVGKIETSRPTKKTSIFKKNRKKWIIVLSALLAILVLLMVLIWTSNAFTRARDEYVYLHSDLGKLGTEISIESATRWQVRLETVKSRMKPYFISMGICGVLALTTLVSDILLIAAKSKNKDE